jgi:ubiquinone/menaquinone biosynthesis C-methylase UbiE
VDLANVAVCPGCRCRLQWEDNGAYCSSCQSTYACAAGIPILVSLASDDAHKRQQAQFFDEADAEYEISRPRRTPALHGWLIEEKFRRSVASLRSVLPGATVLTVCGGSGMDAEVLARAGGRVVSSDLSLEAARRVLERSRRYDVPIQPVVADAERLPFADRSFDLVYVHDGLHHLADPLSGLSEMARVAKRAVSINEPAQAAATRVAIRLGVSDVKEEAGNYIRRLPRDEITGMLKRFGFDVLLARRYAMFYRHEPGPASSWLSHEPFFFAARTGLLVFNRIAGGRIGNKLTVQAVRRDNDVGPT